MPPAPLPADGGGSSAIGGLIAGGNPGAGADQVRAQLESLASSIRDIGQMVDAVAADYPNAAQEVSQIKNLLKQVIVKVAQQAPPTTASGSAVPTGASQGPAPM